MENSIARHAKIGREVRGSIELRPQGAVRPSEFEVRYEAIGPTGEIAERFEKSIPNEAPR